MAPPPKRGSSTESGQAVGSASLRDTGSMTMAGCSEVVGEGGGGSFGGAGDTGTADGLGVATVTKFAELGKLCSSDAKNESIPETTLLRGVGLETALGNEVTTLVCVAALPVGMPFSSDAKNESIPETTLLVGLAGTLVFGSGVTTIV